MRHVKSTDYIEMDVEDSNDEKPYEQNNKQAEVKLQDIPDDLTESQSKLFVNFQVDDLIQNAKYQGKQQAR